MMFLSSEAKKQNPEDLLLCFALVWFFVGWFGWFLFNFTPNICWSLRVFLFFPRRKLKFRIILLAAKTALKLDKHTLTIYKLIF